jgi:hypothetical protein
VTKITVLWDVMLCTSKCKIRIDVWKELDSYIFWIYWLESSDLHYSVRSTPAYTMYTEEQNTTEQASSWCLKSSQPLKVLVIGSYLELDKTRSRYFTPFLQDLFIYNKPHFNIAKQLISFIVSWSIFMRSLSPVCVLHAPHFIFQWRSANSFNLFPC